MLYHFFHFTISLSTLSCLHLFSCRQHIPKTFFPFNLYVLFSVLKPLHFRCSLIYWGLSLPFYHLLSICSTYNSSFSFYILSSCEELELFFLEFYLDLFKVVFLLFQYIALRNFSRGCLTITTYMHKLSQHIEIILYVKYRKLFLPVMKYNYLKYFIYIHCHKIRWC